MYRPANTFVIRMAAQHFADASSNLRFSATSIQQQSASLAGGTGGWHGAGAEAYQEVAGHLREDVGTASEAFARVAAALHALASQLDQVNSLHQQADHLKSEIHALESRLWGADSEQRDSIHSQISQLSYRHSSLIHEADVLEARANLAADQEFHEIGTLVNRLHSLQSTSVGDRFKEAVSSAWHKVTHAFEAAAATVEDEIIPALESLWENIEDDFEKYGEPILEGIWNGTKELLDIPEMEAAWHKLTAPDSSWKDRLFGATTLIVDGALDIGMLIGIGDVAKGAKFLAKFGWKYGTKLLEKEGRKEIAGAVAKGAERVAGMAREVRDGAGRLIRLARGLPGELSFATAGGAGRIGGFTLYDKAKESVVRFAGTISKELASYLGQGKKVRNAHLAEKTHPITGVPYDEYGFPIFESKFEMNLDPADYMKTRGTHFRRANEQLYQSIMENPELQREIKLSADDLDAIRDGENPFNLTWHHHQEPGRMQLVDKKLHAKSGHNGGYDIWGLGSLGKGE